MDKKEKYEKYAEFLVEYNEKVNLTAITSRDEIFEKHFADSTEGLRFLNEGARVCDIGTGAGFPAVPFAIEREDLDIVAVDSLMKRITFLEELKGVIDVRFEAVHMRAEDYAKEHRESFDAVTARAVAPMATLCEYALPLVKVGGVFLAYKGNGVDGELEEAKRAIGILGGKVRTVYRYTLKTGESRAIAVVEKVSETPKKYPRSGNKPRIDAL